MPRRKKNVLETVKTERKNEKIPSRLLGMKDLYQQEFNYFDYVSNKAIDLAQVHGFSQIKTPILESYDLFKKSTRKNTGKEFYYVDGEKGEKSILRPELTQGIIRTYLENNTIENILPTKLFSFGSIFRHDKLQTGHYRESTQLDLEVLGDSKPLSEALLIAIVYDFFEELQIKVQVQINSLGAAECRREYSNKLSAFYKERGRRSKLCNHCKNNLGKNCLSLLDCKEDACLKLAEEAPQIADYLSVESREHLSKTLEALDELGINYNFNPYLVRGLNYYNDTVFEFWPANDEGGIINKISLAGGGRYDSLIESLGGVSLSGFGLAVGIERTVARIKEKHLLLNKPKEDIVFIAQLGDQAKIKSLRLFKELKSAGFNVRLSFASDSLKNQLEEASLLQTKTSLILGKKEIMDGTVLMRDMESGAQETVVYKKIRERLSKKDKLIEKKVNNRKEGVLYGGF